MSREIKKLPESVWNDVFGGTAVDIGGYQVFIRPVAIEDVFEIVGRISGIKGDFASVGFSVQNIGDATTLPAVINILKKSAPDILEILTGIDRGDILRLPAPAVIKLLEASITVNLGAFEDMEKNLAAVMATVMGGANLASLMSSSFSSATDTDGKASEDTITGK